MEEQHGDGPVQATAAPKMTVIRPVGAKVMRLPTDETLVEFDLPWGEVVAVMLPPDGRKALVQALTGGIVLGADLPPGLNNGL